MLTAKRARKSARQVCLRDGAACLRRVAGRGLRNPSLPKLCRTWQAGAARWSCPLGLSAAVLQRAAEEDDDEYEADPDMALAMGFGGFSGGF